jgi:hypothetical protein
MENRDSGHGERLAAARTKFRDFRSAAAREAGSKQLDLPQAVIQLGRPDGKYSPGEVLNCEYQIELRAGEVPDKEKIVAVETSVLWMTEGKGDTDIGVHFFERREKKMVQPELLRQTHRLSTVLPATPLSYHGLIVKIVWLIRVKMFLGDGSQKTRDHVFQLGNVENPVLNIVEKSIDEEEE